MAAVAEALDQGQADREEGHEDRHGGDVDEADPDS